MYSQLVLGAVLECSFIAGAEEFLRHALGKVDMHVVSGTPHGELCDIVEKRGLAKFFQTVQGAPASKLEAFRKILTLAAHDPVAVLAIGDSMTEYLAANELGIGFLGIVPEGAENPFPANVAIVPSLAALHALLGID
jgi:phosphoglycolate phosphatase